MMGVWNLEITDEEADLAYEEAKDSDDDAPGVPVSWGYERTCDGQSS